MKKQKGNKCCSNLYDHIARNNNSDESAIEV